MRGEACFPLFFITLPLDVGQMGLKKLKLTMHKHHIQFSNKKDK
jgi:hypothetical protein